MSNINFRTETEADCNALLEMHPALLNTPQSHTKPFFPVHSSMEFGCDDTSLSIWGSKAGKLYMPNGTNLTDLCWAVSEFGRVFLALYLFAFSTALLAPFLTNSRRKEL